MPSSILFALSVATVVASLAAADEPEVAALPPVTPPVEASAAVADPVTVDAPAGPIDLALAMVPGGLTADEVAAKAVAHGPSIDVKHADIEIAAARVDQAIARYMPQLQARASYNRLSDVNLQFGSGALVGATNPGLLQVGVCPDGTMGCVVDTQGVPVGAAQFNLPVILDNYLTQASLSLPISDWVLRAFRGIEAARKSKDGAELAKTAEIRKVATDARISYYNWLRTKAQVAIARDAIRGAFANLQEAETRYRVGVIPAAEMLRIKALHAGTVAVETQAVALEALARSQLAIIMDEPVQDYAIGEDILQPALEEEVWPEIGTLVEEAHKQRPELASLQAQQFALDSGIKSQRAGYYPRLEATGEATYANPNSRYFPVRREWRATWSAGVSLTWNFTSIASNRTQIMELQAQGRGLDAQVEQITRAIELEVTNAWIERARAIAAVAPAEVNREASEAAYAATSAQFRTGAATATDVVQSQSQVLSARLQAINARIDIQVANERLAYSTGRAVVPGQNP